MNCEAAAQVDIIDAVTGAAEFSDEQAYPGVGRFQSRQVGDLAPSVNRYARELKASDAG